MVIVSATDAAAVQARATESRVDGIIHKDEFAERVLALIDGLFDRRRSGPPPDEGHTPD